MPTRWPDVVFSGDADPAVLSRAVARGTLRRLARGIDTGGSRCRLLCSPGRTSRWRARRGPSAYPPSRAPGAPDVAARKGGRATIRPATHRCVRSPRRRRARAGPRHPRGPASRRTSAPAASVLRGVSSGPQTPMTSSVRTRWSPTRSRCRVLPTPQRTSRGCFARATAGSWLEGPTRVPGGTRRWPTVPVAPSSSLPSSSLERCDAALRLALMSRLNAELVAGGEVRIIIPTVYRSNYLAALKGATHTGHYAALFSGSLSPGDTPPGSTSHHGRALRRTSCAPPYANR